MTDASVVSSSQAVPTKQHGTRILYCRMAGIGFKFSDPSKGFLAPWTLDPFMGSLDSHNLLTAATALKQRDIPVAFPTETVYGLGASALASRSQAVKAIFAAKGRPADNPLIVHVSSLDMLARLLRPPTSQKLIKDLKDEEGKENHFALIPRIYHPLITRFWPGPLTILLPLPSPSPLAPEVTAHRLTTFGARMPSSPLALALIHLADTPLAAPSANTSTRPSPTTAQHVMHDLQGKIDIILDGGPCTVGVESTVVDGLSNPPAVLRPGGVSLEMLRECEGWEGVIKGYQDQSEEGGGEGEGEGVNGNVEGPRAPGMKYKHYCPTSKVVLVKTGKITRQFIEKHAKTTTDGKQGPVGFITTKTWRPEHLQNSVQRDDEENKHHAAIIQLGSSTSDIARGLFSALRQLDEEEGMNTIFVEGIDDTAEAGGEAAAVMNRLRKAAEVQVEGDC